MSRFKLTIEYHGGPFVGWQRQDSGPSVQAKIEDAVSALDPLKPQVFGAGRTDAGVHASGQVAHVDINRDIDAEKVKMALNYFLKDSRIAILQVQEVDENFHARFSAISRSYLFRLSNRRAHPALDYGRVLWVAAPLDVEAMHDAAQRLVGHHDFSSFRAAECQAKSPMKTLDELSVSRQGEEVWVVARSRSFLHRQVRNMVGTLNHVGRGKWTADDVSAVLEAKDRSKAGPTVPAYGLYLTSVSYEEN